MILEISHQGVPLGHTDLTAEGLAIGEFTPGEGYAKVRDVIRDGSKAIWAMGFFGPGTNPPRVAVEDIAAAARLQLELRDERGALVHSDFVNIVERPEPNANPVVFARFASSHAGKPSAPVPKPRSDGSSK